MLDRVGLTQTVTDTMLSDSESAGVRIRAADQPDRARHAASGPEISLIGIFSWGGNVVFLYSEKLGPADG
jgi:hypothetical protein